MGTARVLWYYRGFRNLRGSPKLVAVLLGSSRGRTANAAECKYAEFQSIRQDVLQHIMRVVCIKPHPKMNHTLYVSVIACIAHICPHICVANFFIHVLFLFICFAK
jgi:hypothetical protein